MPLTLFCALVILATTILGASSSLAETRIALVITNQDYKQPGAALANTHRDGDLVTAALQKVGFEVWVARDTATAASLEAAVGSHVERLATAGSDAVGFFYYSGHGAADRPDGINYLIPTQAPLSHVSQLPLVGVRLDRITETVARAAKMSFVVFDACRNVALQRDGKDFGFKGFAPVRKQRGLLVAYATEPGNVAIDQSIYATALAEEIVKPGREAGQVFRSISRKVEAATNAKQLPEFLDKRRHDFHFAVDAPIAAKKAEQSNVPGLPNLPADHPLNKLLSGLLTETVEPLGISIKNQENNVVLAEVTAGTDAALKGIKIGDMILQVSGENVASTTDVISHVNKARNLRRGAVLLHIKSGDSKRYVPVQLSHEYEVSEIGLSIRDCCGEEPIKIMNVRENSDAATKGLKNGDKILSISGEVVKTREDVLAQIKKAFDLHRKVVLLTIRSGDQSRYVPVQLSRP